MEAAEGGVVLQLLGAGLQKARFSAVGAPGLRAVQESLFTSSLLAGITVGVFLSEYCCS